MQGLILIEDLQYLISYLYKTTKTSLVIMTFQASKCRLIFQRYMDRSLLNIRVLITSKYAYTLLSMTRLHR